MDSTLVTLDGWSFNKVLGSGGFGTVELWIHTSGKKLAIKKCKWDITQLTEVQQKRWINEVQIMKSLNHQNIIKAVKLPFKHPDEKVDLPIMCMEFCRKGDLRRVLSETENCCGVNEKQAICIMKDISAAVEYLHSNNITHRDLKPENIVLQEERDNISYKLIDLGYAKELGEASASASIVGTLNYVAPELLWKQKYSCSVDYWSLGILFYEVVTGSRPFLPKMQHTMTWMQHIKSKGYDDICAFESEGKVIFGKEIMDPTHLSKCLKDKLVDWFRVVLQWDPKKRGKQLDENGIMQLMVFKLLQSVLSKKIVYVFSASTYKSNAYEIMDTTSITELQCMIEKDTNIPINRQILTDYSGKILIANGMPLLHQIEIQQDPILFVFKKENVLMENTPTINIPVAVQKMIELSRKQLDHETLKDYYRRTLFFIKQEVHFFQLYIFALSIKVDLVIERFNSFNKNITNALTNIVTLLNKLSEVRSEWEKEAIHEQEIKALEVNFEKVTKLLKATDQIKLKFYPLIQESEELKESAVQSADCMKDISQVYDKAIEIFKQFKNERCDSYSKPTEMVKLVFKFLETREAQFRNENISKIMNKTLMLEVELLMLERIFDSVIAMTTVYHEEFQDIIQHTSTCLSEVSNKKECSNTFTAQQKETTSESSNKDNMEMPNRLSANLSSNFSGDRCNEIVDSGDNIIYDNLVIRYTLDNLLIEIQKKYLEMISLEP
ncbi:inhibitor of nuclear factor kappa B kinase subunit beta [Calliopsis andreniformis]|uniref:inhibitor of nuclear factor kappa B kinase subunit beta n=1 Tax=Calliopsis andreniformis TaxID=337506 RepID=UPI003FCD3273